MSKELILTIDLGTSGPKVCLFTATGKMLHYAFRPNKLLLSAGGAAEQDPAEWWQTIKDAASEVINSPGVDRFSIKAICTTSQWSGTVAVDNQGIPLRNAIIWMDSRGAPYIRKAAKGLINIDGYGLMKLWKWIRITGGAPGMSGKDPLGHILYLKDKEPDIYRSTFKFLEPRDFINLKLSGKFASSGETMTLHWVTDNRDIRNIRYHKGLIKMCGLDEDKLPEMFTSLDIIGNIRPALAKELELSEDVKVVMGTPDLQSAAIGSGAVRDYEAHLYFGTSSWLTCHLPKKKTDLFHNMAALPSAIPGKYFIANEQETAGACLNFLKNNILYPKDALNSGEAPADFYQILDKMASAVKPGCEGLMFTPWLYGERSPIEDHHVRSSFFNQSLQTERKHMVRAVMEGVAMNARWLLIYVEKMCGHKLEAVNLIGGGAKSSIWCQIVADVFNRDIRQVSDPVHANSRGAAYLGAVAMGYMDFDEIAEKIVVSNTFKPIPENVKLYDHLFREFRRLYKKTNKINKRLNELFNN